MTGATEDYRREEDTLADFIDKCCIVNGAQYAYASDLHDAYAKFTGEKITAQAFGRMLSERGYDNGKKGGRRAWFGIGLVSDEG